MHTVAETHAFRRQADAAGMTEEEIDELIFYLSANPMAGVAIPAQVDVANCALQVVGRARVEGIGSSRSIAGRIFRYFCSRCFQKGNALTSRRESGTRWQRSPKELSLNTVRGSLKRGHDHG